VTIKGRSWWSWIMLQNPSWDWRMGVYNVFSNKAKCAVICCTRIGTSHICWIKILSRWWIQLQEFDPLQLSGSPATLNHELLQQRFYPWGPEHDWKRMKVLQLGQSWVSITQAFDNGKFTICSLLSWCKW